MESKRLDSAAQAAGISPSYINAHGKPQSIGADTKRRLLEAMHAANATALSVPPVPAVQVFIHGKKKTLPVAGKGSFQLATAHDRRGASAQRPRHRRRKPEPLPGEACRRAITP